MEQIQNLTFSLAYSTISSDKGSSFVSIETCLNSKRKAGEEQPFQIFSLFINVTQVISSHSHLCLSSSYISMSVCHHPGGKDFPFFTFKIAFHLLIWGFFNP